MLLTLSYQLLGHDFLLVEAIEAKHVVREIVVLIVDKSQVAAAFLVGLHRVLKVQPDGLVLYAAELPKGRELQRAFELSVLMVFPLVLLEGKQVLHGNLGQRSLLDAAFVSFASVCYHWVPCVSLGVIRINAEDGLLPSLSTRGSLSHGPYFFEGPLDQNETHIFEVLDVCHQRHHEEVEAALGPCVLDVLQMQLQVQLLAVLLQLVIGVENLQLHLLGHLFQMLVIDELDVVQDGLSDPICLLSQVVVEPILGSDSILGAAFTTGLEDLGYELLMV